MKRKFLIVLLAIVSVFCLAFGLAACSSMGSEGGGNGDGEGSGDGDKTPAAETISTAEQLMELAGSNKSVKLANNLDLSSYSNWTPIDNFSGTLDGDGHTITGMRMSGSNGNFGLFGTLKGTVKNLSIDGVIITVTGTTGAVGGLCGTNKGSIENITVDGMITANLMTNVGGIIGSSDNFNIKNCTNKANVTGFNRVGGIAGIATTKVANDSSLIEGNKNYGAITGIDTDEDSYIGGLFGRMVISPGAYKSEGDWTYTVLDFENYGDVQGDGGKVGGIIGYYATSRWGGGSTYVRLSIKNCKNEGDVSGKQRFIGGIIGSNDRLNQVLMCSNSGDVTGNSNYVGGIGGDTSAYSVQSCTNSGAVTGKAYIGGIAGYATCTITNSSNSGTITAQGKYSSSSSLGDLTNVTLVGGIVGLTTEQVKSSENTGNIFSTGGGSCVGGIAGAMRTHVGTVVEGLVNRGKITITGGGSNVGGIAGYVYGLRNTTQSGDYTFTGENYGDIEAHSANGVGGILGHTYSQNDWSYSQRTYAVIINCINEGNIYGNSKVGAILGNSEYYRGDDFYWTTNTNSGSLYTNNGTERIEDSRLHN
ncbi:MAG: hypothetical protein J1F68_02280 [Clostridiales bacterium]|nr:hypothetical protein [Clostridiales bacterium]